MNRRRFLELMGMATVGGAVAYSFPSIIVPRNLGLTPLDLAPMNISEPIAVGQFADPSVVFYDEGLHMFYDSDGAVVQYATAWSNDGIHWVKDCTIENGIITIPSFTIPATIS